MVSNQQFRLKWNNHRNTVLQEFETLLHNNSFVDCTIGADGKYLKAHKIVLSACSPYLQNVFNEHFDKHPVILLKDVSFKELKCMIDYMYCGEVNISECELPSFLRTAQSLKIKGLAEDINDYDSGSDTENPEPNSLFTENKRNIEMKMEIRDDEPPAKKSAPSLISANANNSLAARKRKTPNSVPIAGKPNTSNLCKTLAAQNTSNSCKPAEAASSNNASGSENERITNTPTIDDCVNDSDLSETIVKDTTQSDPLEPRSKDVKEEPVDTDADEDNSSYEYNMNNPCDDSEMNEDSESNCTNSGNKFADVSLGNVSSCNENDANDEDSGVMYFKEEVEVLPAEGPEYDEEQEEKFSFDTSDGARNIIVEYRSATETLTEELMPIQPTSPFPVLSQIIPSTLQKILPRQCILTEMPKPDSKILVEEVISPKRKRAPRKSNKIKHDHGQWYPQGYRKILPAPSAFVTTQSPAILPVPEIKSTLSQVPNEPLQVQRIHQSNDSTSSQLMDCNVSAESYPIYLWNANSASNSGHQVMLVNPSSVSATTSPDGSVTASVVSPSKTWSESKLRKNLKRDISIDVAQVTQNFRKIAPRSCKK